MSENLIAFKRLDVWKRNYELTTLIYVETDKFPSSELYGLTQQLRRASISVISNIAEGCGRRTKKEKLMFFYIARGSLFEVESQVEIAKNMKYVSDPSYEILTKKIEISKKVLNGFIKHYKEK